MKLNSDYSSDISSLLNMKKNDSLFISTWDKDEEVLPFPFTKIKEYNKLDKQVDEYINDANKDLSKYYENKEKIGTMQTLAWVIDNLQELLEGRK